MKIHFMHSNLGLLAEGLVAVTNKNGKGFRQDMECPQWKNLIRFSGFFNAG